MPLPELQSQKRRCILGDEGGGVILVACTATTTRPERAGKTVRRRRPRTRGSQPEKSLPRKDVKPEVPSSRFVLAQRLFPLKRNDDDKARHGTAYLPTFLTHWGHSTVYLDHIEKEREGERELQHNYLIE